MANTYKWNYKHNSILPSATIINAPTDNLRGNVIYIDVNNGYIDQAAVDAETGGDGSEIGSRSYPYSTIKLAIADYLTHTIKLFIFAYGTYTEVNCSGSGNDTFVFSDSKYGRINLGGSRFWDSGNDRIYMYDVYIYNGIEVSNGANPYNFLYDSIDLLSTSENYSTRYDTILTSTIDINNADSCILYNTTSNIFTVETRNWYYNCSKIFATSNLDNNHIFWLGSITIGTTTYDLSEAIELGKTEGTILSEMNSLFGTSLSTGNCGILDMPFINANNGNFNLDWVNETVKTEALLNRSISLGHTLGVKKRGIKMEWDSVETNSDFIFSQTSPHYDVNDGFDGLTCYNLNTDGSVINSASDTVAISKIFTLPSVQVFDFVNQFGKLGVGLFDFDYMQIRAVVSGNMVDTFNTSAGYTASYSGGTWTSNLPKMFLNRNQFCNKENDSALGIINLGSYNLNETRPFFKIGAIQFQLIFVKEGV